jgi:hypothetical protein
MLGIVFFYLARVIGGVRELQHATDSGNLNVAVRSIRHPAVSLNPGIEQDNFAGLVDSNGKIDLLIYNRLFAQALIVALNAQSEGTDASKQHAQALLAALQGDQNSVGKRLADALNSATNHADQFTTLADGNTVRMLSLTSTVANVDSEYHVGYLDAGGATNVYFDPTILPLGATLPTNTLASQKATNGQEYLVGYKDLSIDSLNDSPISGVPLQPGDRPHLVSQLAFDAHLALPVKNEGVPPNTFKSVGSAREKISKSLLDAASCAIVSAGKQDYPGCIPRGYICITNLAGLPDNSPVPSNESIFNNQLYSGIYLGVSDSGAVSFSTDEGRMLDWVTYNNDPNPGTKPSTEGIYGADPQGIKSLGGDGYPPEADYTMMSGAGEIPQVAALLPEFEQAYPAPNGQSGQTLVLTAVEKLKALVMALFASGQTGLVPNPPGYTGLRLFDHNAQYPVLEDSSPRFTRTGTVSQLLAQIGNGADTLIMNQLVERIREIKPDTTLADINTLFADNLLEMGDTFYVYEIDGALTMTQTPPPWVVANTSADGNPQDIFSTFETIGFSVNPPGEGGLKNVMFEQTPDPASNGIGKDEVIWIPSCGFNNLLGTLQFQESVTNLLLTMNSPPPPPPVGSPPLAPPLPPPVGPPPLAPPLPPPLAPPTPTIPVIPVAPPVTETPPTSDCDQLVAAANAAIQAVWDYEEAAIKQNGGWANVDWLIVGDLEEQALTAIQAVKDAGCNYPPNYEQPFWEQAN